MAGAITAGAALSLSGRFAVQGEQARRGLVLWAEEANQAGGLASSCRTGPQPVELRIYDDGSKIDGATAGTGRLIVDDCVDLLFSPYGSVLTLAAAEVAERHGRVLWNHGGSSDALEQRGWQRIVTLLSPASGYFVPVLDLAMHQARTSARPVRTVAMLRGASGSFPRSVIVGARAHAASLGLDVVLDTAYPPPIPGPLSRLIRRVAGLQPDMILGAGTTEADLAFARELRRQRVKASIVALVAAPIERFRDELGPLADGFCGPSQWEPSIRGQPDLGPTSIQFADRFRERFGAEPDYPAAQAYAAGLVAARCAEIAGSFEDRALRQAAGTLDLTTFYGRFRLDPRSGRQVGHAMVVAQWQDGQKQVVWPLTVRTAPPQPPIPTPLPTTGLSDEAPFS
jgi:branched-chain amino acid transport system substrate-binding protein